jgi:hypothetical protein
MSDTNQPRVSHWAKPNEFDETNKYKYIDVLGTRVLDGGL